MNSHTSSTPETTPVIAAIGEYTDRPAEPAQALEPAASMARALQAANSDGGGKLLEQIDTIDLIALISWPYENPVGRVCEMLNITPARQRNTSFGGETPLRLIHEAALAITRGEISVAAVIGGESMNAVSKAMKSQTPLDWTPPAGKDTAYRFANDRIDLSKVVRNIGVRDPSHLYPLYETALQGRLQQSPAQGNQLSADLWAEFADVAADNPYAWLRHRPSAEDIGTVTDSNRIISWPYPKLMVANPSVNQSATVIVTSLAAARAAGVPEEQLIYLHGGAAAAEADDFLYRDRYDRSTAQAAVLNKAVEIAGGDASRFRHMELYSCFPVVPKMAQEVLGKPSIKPTVAGGLTFFGGPLNNYMSHAACAMVRALRAEPGELGLLYGQGGFVTKHHTLVLSTAPATSPLTENYSVQAEADAAAAPLPEVNPDYSGAALVEAYTIQFDRDGSPSQGIVVLRSPDNTQRTFARVDPSDSATLNRLLDEDHSAIGAEGDVSLDSDGLPNWRLKG